VELECAGMKGSLKSSDKLSAIDAAEHFDEVRRKPLVFARDAWSYGI
jgi:hypothetical protein